MELDAEIHEEKRGGEGGACDDKCVALVAPVLCARAGLSALSH